MARRAMHVIGYAVLVVALLAPVGLPRTAGAGEVEDCGPLPLDVDFYDTMVTDPPGGWLGGDITGSVVLGPDRVLWLFGDTDWGERAPTGDYLPGWERTTNSAMLQTGSCVEAIGNPLEGERVGFADPDSDELYWPGSGWVDGDRVFITFIRLERTGDPGVFGFQRIQNELVEFTSDLTQVSTQVLPDTEQFEWGESVVRVDDEIFWWGNGATDESKVFGAKSPVSDPLNLTYWDGVGWNPLSESAAVVHERPGQADNATFSRFPGGRWLAVAVDNEVFSNGDLLGWLAEGPMGPYVALGPIADLPAKRDGTFEFTYLATVQQGISLPGSTALLSVSINSLDPAEVPAGVARYRPEFSALRLEPSGEPIQGDFDGDGDEDVFWYAPGATPDWVWWGGSDDLFTTRLTTNVSGTYEPVAGDFDGDGRDDILWYRPGTAREFLWSGREDGTFDFGSAPRVNGTYRPVSGDFDGDGRDDVFWYAAGANPDYVWSGEPGRGFASTMAVNVAGTYRPLTGDFDGDGRGDVFWYAPGASPDYVWSGRPDRRFSSSAHTVRGTYRPFTGDFGGDGRDDVFWNAPDSSRDYIWTGRADRRFGSIPTTAPDASDAFVGDFDGNTRDDVFWYEPGGGSVWYEVPAVSPVPCNGVCVAGVN